MLNSTLPRPRFFARAAFTRAAFPILAAGAALATGCGELASSQDTSALANATNTPAIGIRPRSRAVGASCQTDLVCESLRCSVDRNSPACGQCLTVRHLGETCGGALETCTRSATCTDGRCVTLLRGPGESCTTEPKGEQLGTCDRDLTCVPNGDHTHGTCLAQRTCLEADAQCVASDAYLCGGKVCGDREICSDFDFSSGPTSKVRHCIPRVSVSLGLGDLCQDDNGIRGLCDGATSCQPTVTGYRCVADLKDGDTCGGYKRPINAECGEGTYCNRPLPVFTEAGDDRYGVCAPAPSTGLGASCSGYADVDDDQFVRFPDCDPGLECRGQTCQAACE